VFTDLFHWITGEQLVGSVEFYVSLFLLLTITFNMLTSIFEGSGIVCTLLEVQYFRPENPPICSKRKFSGPHKLATKISVNYTFELG